MSYSYINQFNNNKKLTIRRELITVLAYLKKMAEIQENLLMLLQKTDENEVQQFINYLIDKKVLENMYELNSLIHLISNISNNHHRTPTFINQVFGLLSHLQNYLKQNFSNSEINVNLSSNYNLYEGVSAFTPLQSAVEGNNSKMVKLLLSSPNIDVNQRGTLSSFNKTYKLFTEMSALHMAIENQNSEILILLMGRKDIDVTSKYVCNEHMKFVESPTINNNTDEYINELNYYPNPLYKNSHYVKENIYDTYNEKPPLYLAVESNNVEIVLLLISNPGIDVNSKFEYIKESTKVYEKLPEKSDSIEYSCSVESQNSYDNDVEKYDDNDEVYEIFRIKGKFNYTKKKKAKAI